MKGKRERQVFTPVHEIPMTAESNDRRDHSPRNCRASLNSQSEPEPHHARPSSLNSVESDSTARSQITGPSMAWDSVSSRVSIPPSIIDSSPRESPGRPGPRSLVALFLSLPLHFCLLITLSLCMASLTFLFFIY